MLNSEKECLEAIIPDSIFDQPDYLICETFAIFFYLMLSFSYWFSDVSVKF